MKWVHCNKCKTTREGNRQARFSVTSCGHIFCEICSSTVPNNTKCLWCQCACRYIPITKDMPESIKMYFQDPMEHLTKFFQSNSFQQMHKKMLVEHGDRLTSTFDKSKRDWRNTHEAKHKLSIAYEASQREINYLKGKLQEQNNRSASSSAAYTPNGKEAFACRISPYDCPQRPGTGASASFLDRSSFCRTPNALPAPMNRTVDSCGSELISPLPTDSSGANSARTLKQSPFEHREPTRQPALFDTPTPMRNFSNMPATSSFPARRRESARTWDRKPPLAATQKHVQWSNAVAPPNHPPTRVNAEHRHFSQSRLNHLSPFQQKMNELSIEKRDMSQRYHPGSGAGVGVGVGRPPVHPSATHFDPDRYNHNHNHIPINQRRHFAKRSPHHFRSNANNSRGHHRTRSPPLISQE